MRWSYLEVRHLVTPAHVLIWKSRVWLCVSVALYVQVSDHFVEPRKRNPKVILAWVVVLRSWLVSQFVLDNCEHFTNRKKDSASEFVLIVLFEPFGDNLARIGCQNLRHWQFRKRLLLKNVEVIDGCWSLTISFYVGRCCLQLAHNLFRLVRIINRNIEVNGRQIISFVLLFALECLRSFEV